MKDKLDQPIFRITGPAGSETITGLLNPDKLITVKIDVPTPSISETLKVFNLSSFPGEFRHDLYLRDFKSSCDWGYFWANEMPDYSTNSGYPNWYYKIGLWLFENGCYNGEKVLIINDLIDFT